MVKIPALLRGTSPSWRIFLLLMGILTLVNALMPFLPTLPFFADQSFPPAWQLSLANLAITLVLYGGLGSLGLTLVRRLGWPEMWSAELSLRHRLVYPTFTGLAVGAIFILVDCWISPRLAQDLTLHPPFPTSLAASISAGIGEEILFRLFLIPFWVWLFSQVLLKGRAQTMTFWIATLFSALAFAAGHLPSLMILAGASSPAEFDLLFLFEIFILNGILSFAAAYWLRKAGFLATVSVHLWTDIVWHVIWGLVQNILP